MKRTLILDLDEKYNTIEQQERFIDMSTKIMNGANPIWFLDSEMYYYLLR
jgi:hypothetical protein